MADNWLLSLPEAAQRLGVSRYTLRAWIRQKRIGHVKLGRRVLLAASDIEAFIEANRVAPARFFARKGLSV